MTRTIELYGRLKETASAISLELTEKAKAGDVLELLKAKLGDRCQGAALATEDAVLGADELVPRSGRLAALPPVCGG